MEVLSVEAAFFLLLFYIENRFFIRRAIFRSEFVGKVGHVNSR